MNLVEKFVHIVQCSKFSPSPTGQTQVIAYTYPYVTHMNKKKKKCIPYQLCKTIPKKSNTSEYTALSTQKKKP